MYGDGYIGQRVRVIKRRVVEKWTGLIYDSTKACPDLIGKEFDCVDAYDDRYDSAYPTGHETITLILEKDGVEYRVLSDYCQIVKS